MSVIFCSGISRDTLYAQETIGGEGYQLGEFRGPYSVAIDLKNHRLYVGEEGNQRIQILDWPSRKPIGAIDTKHDVHRIAVDDRGYLYADVKGGSEGDRIVVFDSNGWKVKENKFPGRSESDRVTDFKLGNHGRIYVLMSGGSGEAASILQAVDDGNLKITADYEIAGFGPDSSQTSSIAVDETRGRIYVGNWRIGTILVLNLDGTANRDLPRIQLPIIRKGYDDNDHGIYGLFVDPQGTLYAAGWTTGLVLAFNPNGALIHQINLKEAPGPTPSLGRPTGMAISPEGQLIISDLERNHLKVFDSIQL